MNEDMANKDATIKYQESKLKKLNETMDEYEKMLFPLIKFKELRDQ